MPEDMIEIIDETGTPRYLMPPTNQKKVRAYQVYGDTGPPLLPRDQWKPVRIPAPVYDQDGQGACNAFATIETMEAAYRINGIQVPKLSTGYLYGNINGQRDQGSMLEDAIEFARQFGTCPETLVGMLDWQQNKWPQNAASEALKYRVVEWYWCPTFEHVASAMQHGFAVNIGVMWYENDRTDSDGWLPDRPSGRAGGHAIMRCALENLNGKWGIGGPNSWGKSWGKNGWMTFSEIRMKAEQGDWGWFAVRAMTYPDQGDLPVPS